MSGHIIEEHHTDCTAREQYSDSIHRRINDVLFILGEWGADD